MLKEEEEESRVAAVGAIVEAVGDDDVMTAVEKVAAVLLAGGLKPLLLLQPRPELATAMDCRILAVSESGFHSYGWQNFGCRLQNFGSVGVGVSQLWMAESSLCRSRDFTAMDGRIWAV